MVLNILGLQIIQCVEIIRHILGAVEDRFGEVRQDLYHKIIFYRAKELFLWTMENWTMGNLGNPLR